MPTPYFTVTPLQPPFSLGRDDSTGCWTYAFNIEAWKAPSSGSSTVEELASYLEGQGLTSVFRYVMPDRPNVAIALVEYPGRPGEKNFGSAAIAREYPRLQVQVRGDQNLTVEPRERAETVYRLLGAIQNVTL